MSSEVLARIRPKLDRSSPFVERLFQSLTSILTLCLSIFWTCCPGEFIYWIARRSHILQNGEPRPSKTAESIAWGGSSAYQAPLFTMHGRGVLEPI